MPDFSNKEIGDLAPVSRRGGRRYGTPPGPGDSPPGVVGVGELLLRRLDVRRERPVARGGLQLADEVGVVLIDPMA